MPCRAITCCHPASFTCFEMKERQREMTTRRRVSYTRLHNVSFHPFSWCCFSYRTGCQPRFSECEEQQWEHEHRCVAEFMPMNTCLCDILASFRVYPTQSYVLCELFAIAILTLHVHATARTRDVIQGRS